MDEAIGMVLAEVFFASALVMDFENAVKELVDVKVIRLVFVAGAIIVVGELVVGFVVVNLEAVILEIKMIALLLGVVVDKVLIELSVAEVRLSVATDILVVMLSVSSLARIVESLFDDSSFDT